MEDGISPFLIKKEKENKNNNYNKSMVLPIEYKSRNPSVGKYTLKKNNRLDFPMQLQPDTEHINK